jgi:hypothetical protein
MKVFEFCKRKIKECIIEKKLAKNFTALPQTQDKISEENTSRIHEFTI